MAEAETKTVVQLHPADTNGDGKVSDKEHNIRMIFIGQGKFYKSGIF